MDALKLHQDWLAFVALLSAIEVGWKAPRCKDEWIAIQSQNQKKVIQPVMHNALLKKMNERESTGTRGCSHQCYPFRIVLSTGCISFWLVGVVVEEGETF
jgi:hypothetical protein